MRKLFAIAVLPFTLSACTAIFGDSMRDRAMDYQHSEVAPQMKQLPEQDLPFSPAMPIPTVELTAAEQAKAAKQGDEEIEFETPRPAPLVDGGEDVVEPTSLNAYLSNNLNPRLELDGNGSQVLRLDGQFAVAWAAVSDAIVASQYKMIDLNRSTGTYYIEIPLAEQEKEEGFWDWLFGSDEVENPPYLLKMNRSRLGVYLALQSSVDELAEPEINLQVLTEIEAGLQQRSR